MLRASEVALTLALTVSLVTAISGSAQELSEVERIQLSEGFRLVEAMESQWEGWPGTASAVLLVKGEHEFLIGHPSPSDDFVAVAGLDPILGHEVLVRDRVFPPNLLATFPAVGGIPTIVIGTPEVTGQSSTRWIMTLVHEHFHQLQMSHPEYGAASLALDLSGGDQTGMWMLNYPFPYESEPIAAEINKLGAMARELGIALQSGEADEASFHRYLEQRQAVASVVPERDMRYFSLQLWQEGLARYAEIDAARIAAESFEPSQEFRNLPDFVPVGEAAEELWAEAAESIDADFAEAGRVYFYALGAFEGAILDAFRPGWRDRYLTELFEVDGFFAGGM